MTEKTKIAVITLIEAMREERLMEFYWQDKKYGALLLRASEWKKPVKLERYRKKQGVTKIDQKVPVPKA